MVRILAGITGLALGACGTQDATAPPTPGLHVLRGDGVTDTILATLGQTLLVEVRSEAGAPVPGTQVRFDPVERGGQPGVEARSALGSGALLVIAATVRRRQSR